MSLGTMKLTDELADYLRQVSLREPAVLAELRAETAELPMAVMQISSEQGRSEAMAPPSPFRWS